MHFTDQMNRTLTLHPVPKRIVSLVPSQSQYLWDLGLKDELVGISKFCIYPDDMFRTVTRVGGTKNVDIGKILELKPDLVIGNKEENVKEQIEELEKHVPVWMSDVNSLDDACHMMLELGKICGKENESVKMVGEIKASLSRVKGLFGGKRIAYFIWNKPYMVAASNTYIHNVLEFLGCENVFKEEQRYPETTLEKIQQLNTELCLLSSEPFPFTNAHREEIQKALPHAKVIVVSGEIFSWYGSYLLSLESYVKELKRKLDD